MPQEVLVCFGHVLVLLWSSVTDFFWRQTAEMALLSMDLSWFGFERAVGKLTAHKVLC